MSMDIALKIDTGAGAFAMIEVGNITYNICPMWHAAMPDLGVDSIHDAFHGKRAGDIAPILADAVREMMLRKPEIKALEPSNGWGDYQGALEFLMRWATACAEHPNCIVDVS